MKVQDFGREIKKDGFLTIFSTAKSFTVDAATGLAEGAIKVGESLFYFVKDESTGAYCCYYKPAKKNANAHFIRKVGVNTKTNTLALYETNSNTVSYTIELTSFPDNVRDALVAMSDASKNPQMTAVYNRIKDPTTDKIYKIEVPNEKNKKSTDTAYLVIGPHPKKAGLSALYYLTTLKDAAGNDIDLTDFNQIFANGGKAIHRIVVDSTGELKITYYKNETATATMQAFDTAKNIQSWAENRNFDNPKVQELTKGTIKANNTKSVLKWLIPTIAASVIVAGGVATALIGPDQSAQAYQEANTRIVRNIEDLGQEDLLRYSDSNLIAGIGGVHTVITERAPTYHQQGFFGWAKSYPNETIEGTAAALGREIAKELVEKGIATSVEDVNGDKTTKFVYLVSPQASGSKMADRNEMIAYLQGEEMNYTAEEAELFVKAYEDAYEEEVNNALTKGEGVVSSGTVTTPAVDYTVPEINEAILSVIKENTVSAATLTAEGINVAYASTEDQVVFAYAGSYLYKLDLTNGGTNTEVIESNDDLIERIENTSLVKESVLVDAYLSKLDVQDAIDAYETSYAAEMGKTVSAIYVNTGNVWKLNSDGLREITPELTYVFDNGESIEETIANTVVCKEGRSVSVAKGVSYSFLPGLLDIDGACMVYETNGESVIYDSNEIEVATPVVETVTYTDKERTK